MKSAFKYVALTILIIIALSILSIAPVTTLAEEVKGPPLDSIPFEVVTVEAHGVLGVAEGRYDVFMWSMPLSDIKETGVDVSKLKLIPTVSTLYALVFNPYSDDTPEGKWGVATDVDDESKHFNPLALREVRYAINWLIDRQHIVNEILKGGANPMYTPIGPSHPAYPHIESVIKKLGLTATGDEAKALKTIENAVSKAATELEKYGYILRKGSDGYWYFKAPGQDEEPVTLIFVIRPEDTRREVGDYVASQLEKAGFKVMRLYLERREAVIRAYFTDPKSLEWHIYTEGWVSIAEAPWIDADLAWYYSAWAGFLPSAVGWEYKNDTIEDLTLKLYQGKVKTADEYWEVSRVVTEMGVQESIRVFISENLEYFVVSPQVTNLVYGRTTGLYGPWSFRVADIPGHKLRIVQFSAAGALLMSSWNPAPPYEGPSDIYGSNIWRYVRDYAGYWHPTTGIYTPIRATWRVEYGNFTAPAAIIYDSAKDAWVPAKPITATTKVIYNFKFGRYHSGRMMTLFDILFRYAWLAEWAHKDGPDDKWYHSEFEESWLPFEETMVGIEIINTTAIAVYGTYKHPVSPEETAAYYALWTMWPPEIVMAMEYCVLFKGPESGKTYGWYEGEAERWIDALSPEDSVDIKAALEIIGRGGYTPPYYEATKELAIRFPQIVPPDMSEAASLAIGFIETHGHAAISNGPFYIDKYVPAEMYLELKAFRDPTYPFTPDYWQKKLIVRELKLEELKVPSEGIAGLPITIEFSLKDVQTFPEPGESPAKEIYAEVVLLSPEGLKLYVAKPEIVEEGPPTKFKVTLPSAATMGLPTGTYSIEIRIGRLPGIYVIRESRALRLIGIMTTPTPPTTPPTTPTTPTPPTTPTTPTVSPSVTTIIKTQTKTVVTTYTEVSPSVKTERVPEYTLTFVAAIIGFIVGLIPAVLLARRR